MSIRVYLVPISLAVFVMIYPLRGGDTVGLGFLPTAAALALVVLAFATRPSGRRFVLVASDVAVFAYLLLLLVSALVSGVSDMSLRYLTQIITLSIFPFVVIRVGGFSLDDAIRFIQVVPYVTVLSTASMIAIVGPDSLFAYSGFRLGNEAFNPVGIGSAFGLSALASVAAVKLRLCGLVVGAGAIVVSVAILVLTGSRGPMVALAAASVWLLLTRRRLTWQVTIAICVLGATVYVVFGALSQVMVSDRFVNAIDSASLQARFESWMEALAAFSERPLLGHGLGAFETEHGEYVHNVILEHLANGGLILTVSFLAIILDLTRRNFPSARQPSEIVAILALLGFYAVVVRLFSFSMANTKEVFLFLAMAVSCSQGFHRYPGLHRGAPAPRRLARVDLPARLVQGSLLGGPSIKSGIDRTT